jgi:hypothetical protein
LRTAFAAAATALAVLFGTAAAHAATSQYAYTRPDNGAYMAEAWFNSGTHNMSKGRNSFTLKDHVCNDGFLARVEWKGARYTSSRTRWTDCGEESFSIEPNDVTSSKISWTICLHDRVTGLIWCKTNWITDVVT